MHPRIFRQLRVERCHEDPPVANEHRLALVLGKHLDVLTGHPHPRRPDEDSAERPLVPCELEVGLEGGHLAAVGIPVDLHVGKTEVVAIEDDHPGAGTQDRRLERPDRLVEPVQLHQPHERRGLPARDDQPVEPGELLRLPDLHRFSAEPAQHRLVLAEVSLDCQYADPHLRPSVGTSVAAKVRAAFHARGIV